MERDQQKGSLLYIYENKKQQSYNNKKSIASICILGVHSNEVMMNSNEEGVQKVSKHILI